jgi:hypothetical protein
MVDKTVSDKSKTIENLILYFSGKLNGFAKKSLEQKLKKDRELREIYKLLKSSMKDKPIPDTAETSGRLKSLSNRMFEEFKKGKMKNINIGINIYDSGVLPTPSGVRPSIVDTRRLKYKFDEFTLEIALYPVTVFAYELVGFIDRLPEGHKYRIELLQDDQILSANVDDANMFLFKRISMENNNLRILCDGDVIGIIDLKL